MTKSTLKYIQSLQQKKFRDEHGVFLAEGFKTIADLLSQNILECLGVYITDENKHETEINYFFQSAKVEKVSPLEMERISLLKEPPGAVAIFRKPTPADPVNEKGIILALDIISDPGNLGTIVRTADWFGVKHIVCQQGTVELFNPKVVQSTMASIGKVNVYYTDLETWLKIYPNDIYAATMNGHSLSLIQKPENAVVVIGNESHGVSTSIEKLAKFKITIPGHGKTESLNAAIAAGIILYRFCTI